MSAPQNPQKATPTLNSLLARTGPFGQASQTAAVPYNQPGALPPECTDMKSNVVYQPRPPLTNLPPSENALHQPQAPFPGYPPPRIYGQMPYPQQYVQRPNLAQGPVPTNTIESPASNDNHFTGDVGPLSNGSTGKQRNGSGRKPDMTTGKHPVVAALQQQQSDAASPARSSTPASPGVPCSPVSPAPVNVYPQYPTSAAEGLPFRSLPPSDVVASGYGDQQAQQNAQQNHVGQSPVASAPPPNSQYAPGYGTQAEAIYQQPSAQSGYVPAFYPYGSVPPGHPAYGQQRPVYAGAQQYPPYGPPFPGYAAQKVDPRRPVPVLNGPASQQASSSGANTPQGPATPASQRSKTNGPKETSSLPSTPGAPSPAANTPDDSAENMNSPSWPHTPAASTSVGHRTPVPPASTPLGPMRSQTPQQRPPAMQRDMSVLDRLVATAYPLTHEVANQRRSFFESLLRFSESKGQPISAQPTVSKQVVDLHRLYIAVRGKGGFEQVTKTKSWKFLCAEANPELPESSAAGYQLRKHYVKYLLEFECLETGRDYQQLIDIAEKQKKPKRRKEPAASADMSLAAAQQQQQQRQQTPPFVPEGNWPSPGPQFGGAMPQHVQQPTMPRPPWPNNVYPPPQGAVLPPQQLGYVHATPMQQQQPPASACMPPPSAMPSVSTPAPPSTAQAPPTPVSEETEPNRPAPTALVPPQEPSTSDIVARDPFDDRGSAPRGTGPPVIPNAPVPSPSVSAEAPSPSVAPTTSSCSTPSHTQAPVPQPSAQPSTPANTQESEPAATVKSEPASVSSFDDSSRPAQATPATVPAPMPVQPVVVSSAQMLPVVQPAMPQTTGPQQPPQPAMMPQPQPTSVAAYHPSYGPGQMAAPHQMQMYRQPMQQPPYHYHQEPTAQPYVAQQQYAPEGYQGPYHHNASMQPHHYPPNQPQWQTRYHPQHHPQLPSNAYPPQRPVMVRENVAKVSAPAWYGQNHPNSSYGTAPGRDPRQAYAAMAAQRREQQQQQQQAMAFPYGTVEATQANQRKRRKLLARDVGKVDAWRLVMSLKSGLDLESHWALNIINILLYDDSTVLYFGLRTLPGLLEILVENFRRCLMELFPDKGFDTLESNIYEAKTCSSDTTEMDTNETFSEEKLKIRAKIVMDMLGDRMPDYSRKTRTGRVVRHVDAGLAPSRKRKVTPECEEDTVDFDWEQKELAMSTEHLKPKRWIIPKKHRFGGRLRKVKKELAAMDETAVKDDCTLPEEVTKLEPTTSNEDIKTPLYFRDPSAQERVLMLSDELASLPTAALPCLSDSNRPLICRCLALSNVLRGLCFVPGNETEMAKHSGLLAIVGRLLLLCHQHVPNVSRPKGAYPKAVDQKQMEQVPVAALDLEADLLECVRTLREDSFVLVSQLSAQLDLFNQEEQVSRPILDALIHWSICAAPEAKDPLAPGPVSPLAYSLEALCKLSVLERNVDLILATGPWPRIERFVEVLGALLGLGEDVPIREFAIVLVHAFCGACQACCSVCALDTPAVHHLVAFLELADSNMHQVVSQHGMQALRDNPELMGTSVGMLRRAASILQCLSKVSICRPRFVKHQQRLLQFTMSQLMDSRVAAIIADTLYELQKMPVPSEPSSLCKREKSVEPKEEPKSEPSDALKSEEREIKCELSSNERTESSPASS